MGLRPRWSFALLFTLLWRLALLTAAGELHQRKGRALLNRDLSHDEIIRYYDKLYAHWSDEARVQVVEEYKRRVLTKGWQWGIPHEDEQFLDLYYFLRNRTQVPSAHGWSPDKDRCAPGCHLYGTCNQEEGRCDCPRGRTGPDCSTPLATKCTDFCHREGECIRITQELCINSCNYRGHCVSGTCHCYPGYFGSDCSLSTDYATNKTVILAGLNYEPNPRGPKIYVYEFPPQYHLWTLTWLDRPYNVILWERILGLRLRTADPEEADYFFIPGCGRGCNRWNDKFKYITERYAKYWARRNGRDHLMTHAGDWGRCEGDWVGPGKPYHPHLQNVTLLHLWGLTQDRTKETAFDLFRACHHPNKDIVLPSMNGDMFGGDYQHSIWHPRRSVHPIKKTTLASVAGSLCGWNSAAEPPCDNKYYSFGVRAALWTLLRDKPGFHIAKRVASLGQSMVESEFCFTPAGAGFGRRNVMAVTLGCIPVTISDHVMQPYEPFLDWNDFGVIIPEQHINDVEEILRGFTMEQKAAKMEKLRCAAEHVTYSSVYGGVFQGSSGRLDAVATLVAILRVRLRHPGVPDHQLMEVDAEFRDFMNCKLAPPGAAKQQDEASRPPAPPMPLAKDTSRYRPSSDDDAFPQRTVTTLGWVVAANGERKGRDHSAKALGFFPGERERDLCYFNGRSVMWHDGLSRGPDPGGLEEYKRQGLCLPREGNRPGGYYPGSSVTCPPTRPLTECELLV